MPATNLQLLEPAWIHCVFCTHRVDSGIDTNDGHAAMDRHHEQSHPDVLSDLTRPLPAWLTAEIDRTG